MFKKDTDPISMILQVMLVVDIVALCLSVMWAVILVIMMLFNKVSGEFFEKNLLISLFAIFMSLISGSFICSVDDKKEHKYID